MADEPSPDAEPAADARAGASTTPAATEGVNQGATGNRPLGETPLSTQTDKDSFDERPEAFVGAAFAGGLALALLLRRLAR